MITYRKQTREYNVLQESLKWIIDIIVFACLVIMFTTHLANPMTIIGHSMETELNNNDKVLINKFEYRVSKPDRYDIIAFKPLDSDGNDNYLVKRIIGLPGEKVLINEGKIYINGKVIKDDVVKGTIYNPGIAKTEITLGKNEYFVLGDNRNNSEDSRQENVGMVKEEEIIGPLWMIYSPMDRIKFLN